MSWLPDISPEIAYQALKKDPQAFGEVYIACNDPLIDRATRIVGNPPAEDMVQTLWCKVWRWTSPYREPQHTNIGAILEEALTNLSIDFRRKDKPTLSLDQEQEGLWSYGDYLEDPRANTFTGQIADHDVLNKALKGIPYKQRAVLEMRFWEDYEFKRIADIQGIARVTARTRAHKGLRLLEANPILREAVGV